MRNDNEKKIIDGICQGNMACFQQLVEQYKKKIFFLAYEILGDFHEAEDISQEVFIKVFRFIKKFRKDAKMSTWIHQITVNTCIDMLRKKSTRPHVLMEDSQMEGIRQSFAEEEKFSMNPEENLLMQIQINHLLEKISPRERSVVVLRYLKEFKISEISEILKISSGAIKSMLSRARKKLQKEYSAFQNSAKLEVSHE